MSGSTHNRRFECYDGSFLALHFYQLFNGNSVSASKTFSRRRRLPLSIESDVNTRPLDSLLKVGSTFEHPGDKNHKTARRGIRLDRECGEIERKRQTSKQLFDKAPQTPLGVGKESRRNLLAAHLDEQWRCRRVDIGFSCVRRWFRL